MANEYEIFEFLEEDNTHACSSTMQRRRRLRGLCNPFDLEYAEFIKRYRLTKNLARNLCDELSPYMKNPSKSTGLSVETKVLTALSFYATGSYQRPTGNIERHSMAQQTVSSSIAQVTACLNSMEMRQKYISFPSTDQERNRIKTEFYYKFNIPGVLGCIDCTHIAIVRPAENEERYICCKHYHSLNVQIVPAGMLGARLKSWMEAQLGRAKKRKQKQARQSTPPSTGPVAPPHLSSPESAYSTGYSTDGTSPGTATALLPAPLAAPLVSPPPPPAPPTTHLYHEPKRRLSTVRCCVPEPPICATPSPRPRCRIRTNPWLGATSPARRRPPHLPYQQSLQVPTQPLQLHHAPYSLDSHTKYGLRSPHISPRLSPEPYRSPIYYRGGASSDEECRGVKTRGRETAILSDADVDSDGDTGLDGGDEDEPDGTASPGRRRARRRRPPRRPPRSAGATPPRMRRRHAPSAPPVRERDPLLEADREAERKYRELIREAEKLLVTVSRAPLEPPHNPRVRELRATEVEAPRRSPERTHITNFMKANSPEPPRRSSPIARRSPLAAPPPPHTYPVHPTSPTDRPHSEPPKRKAYARDEVLQTLEGLRKSLQQQSALLAVQRTRLDSL